MKNLITLKTEMNNATEALESFISIWKGSTKEELEAGDYQSHLRLFSRDYTRKFLAYEEGLRHLHDTEKAEEELLRKSIQDNIDKAKKDVAEAKSDLANAKAAYIDAKRGLDWAQWYLKESLEEYNK
jgi:hypothetical protein